MKVNEKLESKLSKKIKISLNNSDNALPVSNFAIDNSKKKTANIWIHLIMMRKLTS